MTDHYFIDSFSETVIRENELCYRGGASRKTRTEKVTSDRSELLNGGPPSGQKLKMVELTERFGVKPVRYPGGAHPPGLRRLLVGHRSAASGVRDLSIDDIRRADRGPAARANRSLALAVELGDLQWETGILAAAPCLERTAVTGRPGTVSEDWSGHHRGLPSGPC